MRKFSLSARIAFLLFLHSYKLRDTGGAAWGKVICHDCVGRNCTNGQCYGDFCVDHTIRYHVNIVPPFYERRCYNVLAGNVPDLGAQIGCHTLITDSVFESYCACSDHNFCNAGAFREGPESSGPVNCPMQGNNGGPTMCRGQNCLYYGEYGCVGFTGAFRFMNVSLFLPNELRNDENCIRYQQAAICSCATDNCTRAVESMLEKPVKPHVICRDNSQKPYRQNSSCFGSACILTSTNQRGCINAHYPGKVSNYCSEFNNGISCICQTDYCNVDIERAVASVRGHAHRTLSTSSWMVLMLVSYLICATLT